MPRKTATRARKAVQTQKQPVTFVMYVLDGSGSMGGLRSDVDRMLSTILDTSRKASKQYNQTTLVGAVAFDNTAEVILQPVSVEKVKTIENWYRGGMTALFDALGLAIETLKPYDPQNPKADIAFQLTVMTDGHENASTRYNSLSRIRELIQEVDKRDNWTLTFQVPPGSKTNFCHQFSIPEGNVVEWEATKAGVEKVTKMSDESYKGYFAARSLGVKKLTNFYVPVITDLEDVTKKTLKQTLTDISGNFKEYTVVKEAEIKPFVEQKTKKPYVKGSVFYQLMKSEKVQPQKGVVITEKATGKIWGGQEARDLIGLPAGQHAKVTPGNHSKYEIFIESQSTNRKLPRGTKILVDRTLTGV